MNNITDLQIKIKIPSLEYTEVKNQLRKVSQLIIDTIQSDLNKKYLLQNFNSYETNILKPKTLFNFFLYKFNIN